MHIKNLIASRQDWVSYLENELHIHVHCDGDLVSLKYNQIESPMHEPVVQECRGMVVDLATERILAHPYNKFWNHGEPLAAEIDWSTARVLEKLDGSLMTLYFHHERDEWAVASSGTPRASGSFGTFSTETFRDAFWRIWNALGYALPGLRDVCFMFELCAHENRIVVKHEKPRIVLHGARDLRSGFELSLDDLAPIAASCGWEVVKSYPIGSIDDALAAADALDPLATEGFVVVDADFNRVKIKSPRYVALHHMRGEGMSVGRAIDLWVSGEAQELLTHFPEFRDAVLKVHGQLDSVAAYAVGDLLKNRHLPSRKDFANAVKAAPWSAVTFKLYGHENPSLDAARLIMRGQSKAALERLARG